ncbi:hypothetical protein HRED_06612, partial [Candidatus Haloredivivus sp. G17]
MAEILGPYGPAGIIVGQIGQVILLRNPLDPLRKRNVRDILLEACNLL